MKRTPLNKVSKKRRKSLYQERKTRMKLIKRSNGVSELSGKNPDFRGLQMHENKLRSQGGKVSEGNSKMITGKEHSLKHGIKEVDSKPQFKWIPLVLLLFLIFPYPVHAADPKPQCHCVGNWKTKVPDGFTATDHRYMYYNPYSEWKVRIPPENRLDASDERFYIEPYTPIPVNYYIPQEPSRMPEIDYKAPPCLSEVERVRWGQALPSTRPYLARLWGIPRNIAEQYGAKY